MVNALERLTTLSKYITIILKIIMILIIVGAVLMSILTVTVALNDDMFAEIFKELGRNDFFVIYITTMIGLALAIIVVYELHSLFDNIYREHTPFIEENARILKYISMLVLVSAVVIPIIAIISTHLLGANPDNDYSTFNVGLIFTAFIIYLSSLIFKYGVALQKESDETL